MAKSKCFFCKHKMNTVEATMGKCSCGNVYCNEHRFPMDHECTFDYKKKEREILKKNNPVVVADKIEYRI